jgi:hypothetical protein
MDRLLNPITCTHFEEMKINLPTSLVNQSIYFQNFLFMFTSTTFGFIDFSDKVKTREFIPIQIPVNEYLVIQPIVIKNYHHQFQDERDFTDSDTSRPKGNREREKKDLYEELWLDGTLAKNSELSLEMIKKLNNNKSLYFVGMTYKSIHIYSQTRLLKTFNFYLPKFKNKSPELNVKKKFSDEDDESNQKESSKNSNEGQSSTDVQSEERLLKCAFEKNGVHSTYHESLPQFMFVLIYNCDDLSKSKNAKSNMESNQEEASLFEEYMNSMGSLDELFYNKLKILTFEIISDQFLWVDTVNNVEDNLESYGELKLFKNFGEYLVSVFLITPPKKPKSGASSFLHLVVKEFNKHRGFGTILSKHLNFLECKVPFYDILYSYKKDQGLNKFEQQNGKYSFNKCYSDGKGREGSNIKTLRTRGCFGTKGAFRAKTSDKTTMRPNWLCACGIKKPNSSRSSL